MKKERKFLVLGMVYILLQLLFCQNLYVWAAEQEGSEIPSAVQEVESGVVKLLVYAVGEGEQRYNIRQGTGILIGKQSSGNEGQLTILTDSAFVQVDNASLDIIRRQHGLSTEAALSVHVDIILDMGTQIGAETVNSGNSYVILQPAGTLQGMTSLRLGESGSLQVRDKLYVLGYGGDMDILGKDTLSDLELHVHSCRVAETKETEIITDYQAKTGDIGTPVLNSEGYVVGFYVQSETGSLCIKPIDEISNILTTLNISFEGIDTGSHYNEVTEEIQMEMSALLLECEELAMNKEQYAEKSMEKLKAAINNAIEITNNSGATYDDYQKGIDELNKYKQKLRHKNYPFRVAQISIAAAALFLLILCMRLKHQIKVLSGDAQTNYPLQKKQEIHSARLVRMDTGQQIYITGVLFRIGKSVDGIEYTITDNTSISRHHADIVKRENSYFVVDQNSTNHTFVNEQMIGAGNQVPVKSGDVIRLSDISFRFEV